MKRSSLAMLLAAWAAASIGAQSQRSALRGFITDTSGWPLPGVEVMATSPDGAIVRVVTDVAGWFVLPDLKPGRYDLTASLIGFRTTSRRDIALGPGAVVTIETEMAVGRIDRGGVPQVGRQPEQAAPTGIKGAVTDTCGAVLPGADVVAKSAADGTLIRSVTDTNGRFRFTELAPGLYEVSASLGGFRPFTRADVAVERGYETPLSMHLHLGFRADVGPVITFRNVFDAARSADTVMHLRIERVRGPREVCGVATEYEARAIETVKRRQSSGSTPTFELLQQGSGSVTMEGEARPDEAPYGAGEEFVALLAWNERVRAFVRVGGPAGMIAIRDGAVSSATAGMPAGTSVRELLQRLQGAAGIAGGPSR